MKGPVLTGGRALLFLGVAFALLLAIPVATQDTGPRFSEWGPAVALGPPFTGLGQQQGCPFISKDDLDLYFRARVHPPSNPTGWTWDIFVSHRNSADEPWGTPVSLGDEINTPTSNEFCSFVTIDGHWLYFVSNRTDLPGAYGGQDIFVSHRKNKKDPAGWETPVNLGPYVNSLSNDNGPSIFEDVATGMTILYFTSGKSGTSKIYQSELVDWVNAGPPTEVAELNSGGTYNMHTFVRRKDGLEVIFARGDADWWTDLWMSTRPSTSSDWSEPVRLGWQVDPVDPLSDEARPSLSWDGTTLYFWSDRPGPPYYLRLYMSTRTKITGKK